MPNPCFAVAVLALGLAGCATGPAARVPLPDVRAVRSVSEALTPRSEADAIVPAAGAESRGDGRERRSYAVGPEVQVYPAGVIVAAHGQIGITKRDVLTLRAGYNFTDRRDFGERDDEEGGGPGVGVGVRHFFRDDRSGWLVGGRVDLWSMEIDWHDDIRGGGRREGDTDILVLQPTLEGGYRFRLGPSLGLDLTGAAGFEINVDEDGEDVGDGGIMLIGATLVFDL